MCAGGLEMFQNRSQLSGPLSRVNDEVAWWGFCVRCLSMQSVVVRRQWGMCIVWCGACVFDLWCWRIVANGVSICHG